MATKKIKKSTKEKIKEVAKTVGKAALGVVAEPAVVSAIEKSRTGKIKEKATPSKIKETYKPRNGGKSITQRSNLQSVSKNEFNRSSVTRGANLGLKKAAQNAIRSTPKAASSKLTTMTVGTGKRTSSIAKSKYKPDEKRTRKSSIR